MSQLKQRYPWLEEPVVVSAPMGGFAGPKLATEVSTHGGMGFVGAGLSVEKLDQQLDEAHGILEKAKVRGLHGTLALGVGVLVFAVDRKPFIDTVKKHRPAAVWLFATHDLGEYARWSKAIRDVSPETDIWIQIGSVAGAVNIAKEAAPNVIVAQGIDAGGHGFEKGAGIVSLLPEMSDALDELRSTKPILVAAGGISDGRGVAATMMLGSQGAVLGTRFLCSEEVDVHSQHQKLLLEATDGGQSTVRAKLFDELKGPNIWPSDYDGRSVVTKSYGDFQRGVGIDEIRETHKAAVGRADGGFGATVGDGEAAAWAGTGVGLVKRVQKAADIVVEIRDEAVSILRRLQKGSQGTA